MAASVCTIASLGGMCSYIWFWGGSSRHRCAMWGWKCMLFVGVAGLSACCGWIWAKLAAGRGCRKAGTCCVHVCCGRFWRFWEVWWTVLAVAATLLGAHSYDCCAWHGCCGSSHLLATPHLGGCNCVQTPPHHWPVWSTLHFGLVRQCGVLGPLFAFIPVFVRCFCAALL